jgi:hypothetical protein
MEQLPSVRWPWSTNWYGNYAPLRPCQNGAERLYRPHDPRILRGSHPRVHLKAEWTGQDQLRLCLDHSHPFRNHRYHVR